MDLSEIKVLIEAQGTAFEEFKRTNEALIKAKAEGKSVVDLEAKMARIDTDMTAFSERKAELDAALAKVGRMDFGTDKAKANLAEEAKQFDMQRKGMFPSRFTDEVSPEQYGAYKNAFYQWARKGNIEALSGDERKAMIAGSDPDGGYFLPVATVGRIVQKVYELSPLRQIVNVQNISGPVLEGMYDNDEGTAAYVGEIATRSATTTPQVGKYRIEAFEIYAMPKASQTLLDDAMVDVEGWLAGKIANKFARFEGSEIINGSGISTSKMSGFAAAYTMAATADATRTWGQMEYVKTGVSSDFAASSPADHLFDLIHKFKSAYLQRAKWVTRREVIAKVRKFKEATTNAYMWQPGLQAGQPDSLLGYPIVNAQDIPTLASGSLSMWLGDWQEAYTLVDRQGMRTLRDNLTDKPNVLFYTTRRMGGGVVNFEAIKSLYFGS